VLPFLPVRRYSSPPSGFERQPVIVRTLDLGLSFANAGAEQLPSRSIAATNAMDFFTLPPHEQLTACVRNVAGGECVLNPAKNVPENRRYRFLG
jgi:predicted dienelactone hydrolase